jgi:hypothetical protein
MASWGATYAYEHAGWHGTTTLTLCLSGLLLTLSFLGWRFGPERGGKV